MFTLLLRLVNTTLKNGIKSLILKTEQTTNGINFKQQKRKRNNIKRFWFNLPKHAKTRKKKIIEKKIEMKTIAIHSIEINRMKTNKEEEIKTYCHSGIVFKSRNEGIQ